MLSEKIMAYTNILAKSEYINHSEKDKYWNVTRIGLINEQCL